MSDRRRIEATLEDAEAVEDGGVCAVRLVFRSARGERIEGLADLGPEPDVASARGEATLRRLLRAARRRAPDALRGQPEEVACLLREGRGARMRLEVRARVRLRFTAWTEEGPLVVDDVDEVVEDASGFVVRRLSGRLPVRVPRDRVLRQRTSRETWLEVIGIERA